MPYVPGGTSQGNSGLVEVADVYRSGNVFVNSVPVALWLAPSVSASISLPDPNPIVLTAEQQTAQDEQLAATSAAANSAVEKQVGLAGVGEVPDYSGGALATSESNAAEGTTSTSTVTVVTTSTGDLFIDVARTLDLCLSEAKQGLWKETGSNPRVIGCYNTVGCPQPSVKGDTVPWCAGFVGNVLKKAGAPALKTLSSLAYSKYGSSVPLNDKSKWRLNDVVVFNRGPGVGHVGFFRGYNKTTGAVLIAGGNQADNLTETGFPVNYMPIVYVGRAWSIPSDYDREVTYSGSASSVKVV